MLINELDLSTAKHIKKTEWSSPIKLNEWLLSNNFKFLNRGQFSIAYKQENSNIVVKVNVKFDKCYQHFIDYCNKNKSNPHLPKFGKIVKIGNNFAIFTEFLKSIAPKDEFDYPLKNMVEFMAINTRFSSMINKKYYNYNMYDDDIINTVKEKSDKFKREHSLLANTIISLDDIGSSFNCSFDLTANNFMIRPSTNQIIINDPWFRRNNDY